MKVCVEIAFRLSVGTLKWIFFLRGGERARSSYYSASTYPSPLKKLLALFWNWQKTVFLNTFCAPCYILVHQRSVQSGRQLYFETSIENVCNGRMNVLINFVSPPPFYIEILDSFVNSQEWTLSRAVPDLRLGIVGSLASGKSALVHRYLTGSYMQEESPEGGRFKKEISIDSQSYLLLIRDEGGSPEHQVSSLKKLISKWQSRVSNLRKFFFFTSFMKILFSKDSFSF